MHHNHKHGHVWAEIPERLSTAHYRRYQKHKLELGWVWARAMVSAKDGMRVVLERVSATV
jgi:hypothetical protein